MTKRVICSLPQREESKPNLAKRKWDAGTLNYAAECCLKAAEGMQKHVLTTDDIARRLAKAKIAMAKELAGNFRRQAHKCGKAKRLRRESGGDRG